MLETIKNIIKNVFTEDDNVSADLIPILACAAVLVFLGLSIYVVVVKGAAWNGTDFGIGFGTMQTTFGVAFKLKRDAQTKPLAGEE